MSETSLSFIFCVALFFIMVLISVLGLKRNNSVLEIVHKLFDECEWGSYLSKFRIGLKVPKIVNSAEDIFKKCVRSNLKFKNEFCNLK